MARELGQAPKPVVQDGGIVAASQNPECISDGEGWVDPRPTGEDPALARIFNLEANVQKLQRISHAAWLLRLCCGRNDCCMGLTPNPVSRSRAKGLHDYCLAILRPPFWQPGCWRTWRANSRGSPWKPHFPCCSSQLANAVASSSLKTR